MQRGDVANIVMIGVVTGISEEQDWESATDQHVGVMRSQIITGQDFTWFFNSFNWAILSVMAMTPASALGAALGFTSAGIPVLSGGMTGSVDPSQSNPAMLAQRWYDQIMAGTTGILSRSFVPYQGTSNQPARIPFRQALGTAWENFPDIFIPYALWFTGESDVVG